jgi:hypothetical protein
MQQGGREMRGFVEVADEGLESDEALLEWVGYSLSFVETLPPK